MIDGFVCGKLATDNRIKTALVGVKAALAVNVIANDLGDAWRIGNRDVERADRTAALNKREDRTIVRLTARLGEGPAAGGAVATVLFRDLAVISFVGFDHFAFTAHRGNEATSPHCLADTVAKKPCTLVSDLKRPMDLMGGNALLAGGHEANA